MSVSQVGLQFVYMGLLAILIQGGLLRVLLKKFDEKQLFFVGNIFLILGLFLIPFAHSQVSLTLFLLLMTLGASLSGPTLTSIISKQSPSDQIGSTMGISQGFSALGRVIGPTWGGALFAISFKLPFILTASLVLYTVFVAFHLLLIDTTK